ncbi:hypothetical protein FVR03_00240 [Pontibacter qinzhouensis]|uniref:TIR domain-containing protein n=1 Tax=Pontibacter qinzhouensis TaxID=2603253 RepID=A0A5C8KE82_9BACT|nr:hypothetical protein [Pontibacter qinzhouensis]TXK52838.1 hypothetical protein FVR03_00240 [Pontibacter qinzhouensis]
MLLNTTFVIRPQRFEYRSGINPAFKFASSYSSNLHLLFILHNTTNKPEPRTFLLQQQLEERVQEFAFDSSFIFNSNKIKKLKEHVATTATDLLLFFLSTKSLWEDLFTDSITHEMA